MSRGNEWTTQDVIKSMEKIGEICVHKTIERDKGIRDKIKDLLTQNVVKEVHQNEKYKFYALNKGTRRPIR